MSQLNGGAFRLSRVTSPKDHCETRTATVQIRMGVRSEFGQFRATPAKRKLTALTTIPEGRAQPFPPDSADSAPAERNETLRAVGEAEWCGRKAGESGVVRWPNSAEAAPELVGVNRAAGRKRAGKRGGE